MKRIWITFLFLFLAAQPSMAALYGDGRQTVTTGGTAVALSAAEQLFSELTVCAETNNTGIIVVGLTPVAALATREGVPLNAGDCWSTYRHGDLRNILIDTTIDTDGVTFSWALGVE